MSLKLLKKKGGNVYVTVAVKGGISLYIWKIKGLKSEEPTSTFWKNRGLKMNNCSRKGTGAALQFLISFIKVSEIAFKDSSIFSFYKLKEIKENSYLFMKKGEMLYNIL